MTEPAPVLAPLVPHKTAILIVTLLAMYMAVLDSVIVSIALPSITAFYQTDISLTQWTITGYLVTMTATMLVFSRLSAYYGKNLVFLSGMILFTASSLGCALAPTLPALVVLRIAQGLGAAMSVSILMAIIFEIYSFREQGKVMGILGATVALASLSGPILGGFLVELCGWQSIFFINVPIGMVLVALGISVMDLRHTERNGIFIMDWAGAGFLIAAIVSFMLALGLAASGKIAGIPVAACAVICCAAVILFVRIERHHPAPLLEPGIFTRPNFVVPLLGMCLFFSAVMILYITLPIYLEGVLGFSPSRVGWFFVLMAAILVVGSPLVGRAYDCSVRKRYTPAGLLIAAAGFFLFAVSCGTPDPTILTASVVIIAIGFTLIQSPVNTEIMRGLPAEKSAVASGLNSAGRHFAMACGASVAALIYAHVLHAAGNYGSLTGADPQVLAGATFLALAIAGIFCSAGALLQIIGKKETVTTGRGKSKLPRESRE
ncbi:MAG TPA: MFS transporter [Methanoregula sp.]|nr:MFS transporter [Methanoregula sp.]